MAKFFRNFSTYSTGGVPLGPFVDGPNAQWALLFKQSPTSTGTVCGTIRNVSTAEVPDAPGGKAMYVASGNNQSLLWLADTQTMSTNLGKAPGSTEIVFGGGNAKQWDVLILGRFSTNATSFDSQWGAAMKCAWDDSYSGVLQGQDEYSFGPFWYQYYSDVTLLGFGTERRLNGGSGFFAGQGNSTVPFSTGLGGPGEGGWWYSRFQLDESTGGNGRIRFRAWPYLSTAGESTSWDIDVIPNTNLFSTASGVWAQGGGGAGIYFRPQLPSVSDEIAIAGYGASNNLSNPVTPEQLLQGSTAGSTAAPPGPSALAFSGLLTWST